MIGILDPGVGGLTAARLIRDRLPEHHIRYFGDTARGPFGDKSPETIRRFARSGARYLLDGGVRLLVLASGSLSAAAGEILARELPVPVIDSVPAAADAAADASRWGRIGVLAPPAAVESGRFEREITDRRPTATVRAAADPLLGPLADAGWVNRPETVRIIKKIIRPLKLAQIDTLILGSPRYRILAPLIARKAGRRVRIVDTTESLVRAVHHYLDSHPQIDGRTDRDGRFDAIVSDRTDATVLAARRYFGLNIDLAVGGPDHG